MDAIRFEVADLALSATLERKARRENRDRLKQTEVVTVSLLK